MLTDVFLIFESADDSIAEIKRIARELLALTKEYQEKIRPLGAGHDVDAKTCARIVNYLELIEKAQGSRQMYHTTKRALFSLLQLPKGVRDWERNVDAALVTDRENILTRSAELQKKLDDLIAEAGIDKRSETIAGEIRKRLGQKKTGSVTDNELIQMFRQVASDLGRPLPKDVYGLRPEINKLMSAIGAERLGVEWLYNPATMGTPVGKGKRNVAVGKPIPDPKNIEVWAKKAGQLMHDLKMSLLITHNGHSDEHDIAHIHHLDRKLTEFRSQMTKTEWRAVEKKCGFQLGNVLRIEDLYSISSIEPFDETPKEHSVYGLEYDP